MRGRIRVAAVGRDVVVSVGGETATLTPREAQTFAFQLARAYAQAGQLTLVRGHLVLKSEGKEDHCSHSPK